MHSQMHNSGSVGHWVVAAAAVCKLAPLPHIWEVATLRGGVAGGGMEVHRAGGGAVAA